MKYRLPESQFFSDAIGLIFTDGVDKYRSEDELVKRMRYIWSALTILHETQVDHDDRIVGFNALLMYFWVSRGQSSFVSRMFSHLDGFEDSWKLVRRISAGQGTQDEEYVLFLKLYLLVAKLLGRRSGFAAVSEEDTALLADAISRVKPHFSTTNIVLIAEALHSCILLAKVRQQACALPAELETYCNGNCSLPAPEFIAKIVEALFAAVPIKEDHRWRKWDRETPYAIHPLWMGSTFFLESTLPLKMRTIGFYVHSFHDWREDIDPGGASLDEVFAEHEYRAYVMKGVENMCFENIEHEILALESRGLMASSLKVLDKCSNFLDGVWMEPQRKKRHLEQFERVTLRVLQHLPFRPLFMTHLAITIIAKTKKELLSSK